MKYKYIGTEEQLIENGYSFCEDMSEDGHWQRTNEHGYSYVDGYNFEIFYIDDLEDVQKIQDIIDKGLVVEVND